MSDATAQPLPAMRAAVLGPGGVGGLVAALLSRIGSSVTCLAGSDTAAALRSRGLRLDSKAFGEVIATVQATERLEGPVDACFVTVKATQLTDALDRVPPEVLGGALVVPLLNGTEHIGLLRDRYPDARVVAATIKVESTRTAPGDIRHDSPFADIELAAVPPGPELDSLASDLQRAGFGVRVRDDEVGVLWDKVSILSPLALLTTHAEAPIGAVRSERRTDLLAVIDEVTQVARAEGAAGDTQKVRDFLDGAPEGMQSSMQRDAAAGRPTELDAIGGSVLRAAARHEIDVPVTTRLVRELREREATS